MKATPPNNHSLNYPFPFDITFLSYVSGEQQAGASYGSGVGSNLAGSSAQVASRRAISEMKEASNGPPSVTIWRGGGAHGTHARLRTTRLETGLKFEHPLAGAK